MSCPPSLLWSPNSPTSEPYRHPFSDQQSCHACEAWVLSWDGSPLPLISIPHPTQILIPHPTQNLPCTKQSVQPGRWVHCPPVKKISSLFILHYFCLFAISKMVFPFGWVCCHSQGVCLSVQTCYIMLQLTVGELDPQTAAWIPLIALGDHSLFLGQLLFCVSWVLETKVNYFY